MLKRFRSKLPVMCILSGCLVFHSAHAADVRYKVIAPTQFEMQEQLEKYAKEGWRVRSMAPATCNRLSHDERTHRTVDCFVIVLERSG